MASGSKASSGFHPQQVQPQNPSTSSTPRVDSMSKAIAQYAVDARLHAVYEESGESGKSFDYSHSIKTATDSIAEQQMTAYLSKIQRGGHIQPFWLYDCYR